MQSIFGGGVGWGPTGPYGNKKDVNRKIWRWWYFSFPSSCQLRGLSIPLFGHEHGGGGGGVRSAIEYAGASSRQSVFA